LTRVQARPARAGQASRVKSSTVRSREAARPAKSRRGAEAAVDLTPFLQVGAVSWLFGAGLIHGVWTVMHYQEWAAAGLFFLALTIVQTLGGFVLAVAPRRLACLGIVAVSIGTILVWAVSRSTGLPFGPEAGVPESVGLPDLVSSLFELLTVLAVLPLLRTASGGREAGRMPSRGYLALVGIPVYTLVLTCVAIVPTAAGHGMDPATGSHANHSHG
jgi:hypothetical protein